MNIWRSILQALYMAFAMFWEILWPLILGFALSGVVRAVVSKREISRLLPDDSPRSLAIACGLGAASSSCSYAAVALARSIFGRGANFTAAMAFELASTNLVAELAIILVILMGWQFMIAEFVGAPLMVVIMALLFRALLSPESVVAAKEQANKGIPGSMEGHAEMDMAVTDGPLLRRMLSSKGLTAISHYFVMDWAAIWFDIAVGLLLAGALAVWVPNCFWLILFGHTPDPREILGADYRSLRCDRVVCLLGGKYSARRDALERRNQLWRRGGLHPRRSDCAADSRHISAVLRHEDEQVHSRHVLHLDVCRCARNRIHISSVRTNSAAPGYRRRGLAHVQLHHRPEWDVPSSISCAALALLHHWRPRNA